MKRILSTALLLSICSVGISQKLIFQPQVGVRTFQYKANPNYPATPRLLPSASAGARLIYLSKAGHGPYIGFHANSMILNNYSQGVYYTNDINLLTYEAGYQWMSKPIYFKRIWDNHISREEFEKMPKKGLAVQIMPNLGVSYIRPLNPSPLHNFFLKSATLGLNIGTGFAFSNNGRQLFSLNFGYTAGLYDLYNTGSGPGGSSFLSTKASGFNISLGVPLTLFRKK